MSNDISIKRINYLSFKGVSNLDPEELVEYEKLTNWCYSCLDNLNHCKHSIDGSIDPDQYETTVDKTMEFISESLLSINPDYHCKYLISVRRKTLELQGMYPK